jgi:4-hydroxybenzoate polyprenyltransferase
MKSSTLKINHWLSLIKFSHTIFALPFAIIGFLLGIKEIHAFPSWFLLLKIIACMVFARSAAMAFNRYIDKNYDAKNARTAVREIPAGIIKENEALIFICINCILFVVTTFFINSICFYLSPVALLVILGYSLTKRFTFLCHLILGLGLSLAPIGAYLAVTAHFDWLPLFISLAVLFWTGGFDIIYALQDEEFDKGMNLHSIPVKLGKKGGLMVSSILHVFTALFLIIAGIYGEYSWIYFTGTFVFLALLVYQHSIVSPTDLSRVNLAFGTTNGIASVVFSFFYLVEFLSSLRFNFI